MRSWSKIKSPCCYVLVYCEAVRSAILATAWLLVGISLYIFMILTWMRVYMYTVSQKYVSYIFWQEICWI